MNVHDVCRLLDRAQELADTTGQLYFVLVWPDVRMTLRRQDNVRKAEQQGAEIVCVYYPRKPSKKGFRNWYSAARRAARLMVVPSEFKYDRVKLCASGDGAAKLERVS